MAKDGDIIDVMFGWLISLIGWVLGAIIKLLIAIIGGLFKGIFGLFTKGHKGTTPIQD